MISGSPISYSRKQDWKGRKTKNVFPSGLLLETTAGLSLRTSVEHNSDDQNERWDPGVLSTDSCLIAEDFLLVCEIPSASECHLCALAQASIDVGESPQMEKQRAAGTCRRKLLDVRNHPLQLWVNSQVCWRKKMLLSPTFYPFLPWTKSYVTIFAFLTQLHSYIDVHCPNKLYSASSQRLCFICPVSAPPGDIIVLDGAQ